MPDRNKRLTMLMKKNTSIGNNDNWEENNATMSNTITIPTDAQAMSHAEQTGRLNENTSTRPYVHIVSLGVYNMHSRITLAQKT